MKQINTLVVNGEAYTLQDPNAATKEDIKKAGLSWTKIVDATLTPEMLEPGYLYRCMWEFDEETSANIRQMTEFKLLIKLPFAENISAGQFEIKAFFADKNSFISGLVYSRAIVNVPAGGTDIITLHASKMDDVMFAVSRQFTNYADMVNANSTARLHNNVFDVENLWFKFNLTNKYPLPSGTRVLLEGR